MEHTHKQTQPANLPCQTIKYDSPTGRRRNKRWTFFLKVWAFEAPLSIEFRIHRSQIWTLPGALKQRANRSVWTRKEDAFAATMHRDFRFHPKTGWSDTETNQQQSRNNLVFLCQSLFFGKHKIPVFWEKSWNKLDIPECVISDCWTWPGCVPETRILDPRMSQWNVCAYGELNDEVRIALLMGFPRDSVSCEWNTLVSELGTGASCLIRKRKKSENSLNRVNF